MSTATLNAPAYAITKEQHDKIVEATGRPYTEPYRHFHMQSHGPTGGMLPKAPTGINTPDPHAHRPIIA